MIKDLLFDLDGTLLPMKQEEFANAYFALLGKKFGGLGYDATNILKAISNGLIGMILNEGKMTNELVFWNAFECSSGIKKEEISDVFDDFYANDFGGVAFATAPSKLPKEIIEIAKKKGLNLYLATNPVFPRAATLQRIKWAGLSEDDFLDITTYENSNYCKPNARYFKQIIERNNIDINSALMIGNDVKEDLSIASLGVKTYLVTDCLENKDNLKITSDYCGSLEDLRRFINAL